MENIQYIIDQIPIRHDAFSQLMLMGIFQGVFVATLILFKTAQRNIPTKFLGFFLLAFSLVLLDTYLCYTGLMKYWVVFNDSTEPLVLLWAPLLYLFVFGLIHKKDFRFKSIWYHFLLPAVYFLSQLGYYLHPRSVKLNAYISAYFPDMERPIIADGLSYSYEIVKDEVRWLMLGSFLFYIGLSLRTIVLSSRQKSISTKKKANISKYDFSNNILWVFLVLFLVIFMIFLNFENDLGDHYIATFQAIFIFLISGMILSESRFFEKSWIADKYETLKIQDEMITIEAIQVYVETNQYYLNKDASLKKLADAMATNPNYISKVINWSVDVNFNEFINSYRVDLAKDRLLSTDFKHLTIEAVGNSVGFKSKSAFYRAFKKHTNQSPTVFIKNQ